MADDTWVLPFGRFFETLLRASVLAVLEDGDGASDDKGSDDDDDEGNYCVIRCPSPASQCVRTCILTALFTITTFILLLQAVRLARAERRLFSYRSVILYVGIVESIVGALHWSVVCPTWALILILYLRDLQIVVITYYLTSAALVMFRRRRMIKWIVMPLLAVATVALTAIALLGMSGVLRTRTECGSPIFIALSSFGFLLSLAFVITGVVVFVGLSKRSGIGKNTRRKRKWELFVLVVLYLLTSFSSFSWDLFLTIYAGISGNCYSAIDKTSWAGVTITLLERVWNILFPLWATAIAFNSAAGKKPTALLQTPGMADVDSDEEEYERLQSPSDYTPSQSYYSISHE